MCRRAARDENGHQIEHEVEGPFPWQIKRSPHITKNRILAEELVAQYLRNYGPKGTYSRKTEIIDNFQACHGITRKLAYRNIHKAMAYLGVI
jgi:hypothetical protein